MSSYTDLCRLDPFSQSFEGVRALVGEGKTAGMTQHVGMHRHRQPSLLAVFAQGEVDGRAVQRLSLLTEEERPPWGLHAGPLHQPGLDGADFVPSERVGGGEAPLEASVVQHPAFKRPPAPAPGRRPRSPGAHDETSTGLDSGRGFRCGCP